MKVQRGDVVMIDFPYSDRTGSKIRPAVVVQANALNLKIDDAVFVSITSSPRRGVVAPSQLLIDVSTPEGQQTGLKQNSVVQGHNLTTLDQNLVLRVIGTMSDTLMKRLDDCLKAALDLP
jgi:mRNA interferase MazF